MPITEDALRQIRDRESLYAFLRHQLGWPVEPEDTFTYGASLGLRYHFNPGTFMRLTYSSQWMDLGTATSTPRFDILGLSVGWLF